MKDYFIRAEIYAMDADVIDCTRASYRSIQGLFPNGVGAGNLRLMKKRRPLAF